MMIDDVSWKGGQTLLVIALQSGSTGVERMQEATWGGYSMRQQSRHQTVAA